VERVGDVAAFIEHPARPMLIKYTKALSLFLPDVVYSSVGTEADW